MVVEIQVNEMAVPDDIVDHWQNVINSVAEIFEVPAGLIMRVHPQTIEVFVASNTVDNPYRVGHSAPLDGLYCETVIKTQEALLVPDARADPEWDHNPDIELDMISYLGFPINWPDGNPFGTICVLDSQPNAYSDKFRRLLAHFKGYLEADLELIQKNLQLSGLLEKNREFYGFLAHDLRNPLMAIIFSSNLINEFKDDVAKLGLQEVLGIINSASVYMKKELDDLLTYNLVADGEIRLNPQTVEYAHFIQEEYGRNQIIASMYGVHLDLQLKSSEQPITIDPLRISQVLDNLILTAIRNSEKGSIVQLQVEAHGQFIQTSVIDEGDRIPDEEIGLLFHPIKQWTTSALPQAVSDTVMNLAIVKQIVDLHDGTLTIRKNVEHGNNVSFLLPI